MVYELRTYTLYPGKLKEYLELVKTVGMPIRERFGLPLGYWFTEIGELNQVVHLYAYPDLAERDRLRKALAQEDAWRAYLAKASPMLLRQESKILSPAEFSALK